MGDVNALYAEAFRMVVYCAWRNVAVSVVLLIALAVAVFILWAIKDCDDDGLFTFLGGCGCFCLFIATLAFGVSAVDGFANTRHLAQVTVYEMQRPSVPVKED